MPRGKVQKEATIVIENREQLISTLCEASTLEHMVMCGYLYAIFSLKQSTDEGVTASQLDSIQRWDRALANVAQQEMLHLALVNNLLTSIGGAPYFGRPNFPHPAEYFAPGIQLALIPFNEQSLRHFLYLERPEGISMKDVLRSRGRASVAEKVLTGEEIVPEKQPFATVGHLYRGIQQGFWDLSDKYGQSQVFIGPPETQATGQFFHWPELVAVTDLESALRAIDTIITEGEGAKGDWKKAHFGKILNILNEYLGVRKKNPNFTPARPVEPGYVHPLSGSRNVEIITDPTTAGISNTFNACYEVVLQVLSRFFVHVDTEPGELQTLSKVSIDLMANVMRPLGRLLTRLPLGPNRPGKTAGPSFEMYHRSYLLPHRRPAFAILRERLLEISEYCDSLGRKPGLVELEPIEQKLRSLTASLGSTP